MILDIYIPSSEQIPRVPLPEAEQERLRAMRDRELAEHAPSETDMTAAGHTNRRKVALEYIRDNPDCKRGDADRAVGCATEVVTWLAERGYITKRAVKKKTHVGMRRCYLLRVTASGLRHLAQIIASQALPATCLPSDVKFLRAIAEQDATAGDLAARFRIKRRSASDAMRRLRNVDLARIVGTTPARGQPTYHYGITDEGRLLLESVCE